MGSVGTMLGALPHISATQANMLIMQGKAPPLGVYPQPVDYSAMMAGNRVLHWGEVHDDLGAKRELIGNMRQLSASGVTHLGMEMFFASPESQESLDAYYENPSEETVRRVREQLYYYGHQYNCAPDYERLVVTAVAYGIRVIGIDDHPSNRAAANGAWAATVAGILNADSAARMLVYGGMWHSGHHPTLTDVRGEEAGPTASGLLERQGFPGLVVHLVGGTSPYSDLRTAQNVASAIGPGDLASGRFMIPLERPRPEDLAAIRRADYDYVWPDVFFHTPILRATLEQDSRELGTLGLPDDPYWVRRWRTFLERNWTEYVRGD